MKYADIVSTLAMLVALCSLVWQFYTWHHQEKRKEASALKVFVGSTSSLISNTKKYFFAIRNIGDTGITVLNCRISGKEITEFQWLHNPSIFINAKIEPQNAVRCPWVGPCRNANEIKYGDKVEISYRTDSGKKFCKEYTLSEDTE